MENPVNNWKVDPAAAHTVEGMICSLAGVCDGAQQHDQQGFSGADTAFGHSLAQRAQQGRAFTVKQAQAAIKMVNKYRRQLGGPAAVAAFLTQPVFRNLPVDPQAQRVDVPPAEAQNDRVLSSRDKTAVFKFRYDAELVAAVKAIRGQHRDQKFYASWDPAARVWTVPVNESSISLILAVAERWCFAVEERFLEYQRKVEAKMGPSRMMLAMNGGQNIVVDDGMIQIAISDPAILKEFEHVLGQ